MLQLRGVRRAVAGLLVVGLGVGCGGDSGPTPPDPSPIPGTLALAVSPSADSVQAGSSGSTTVLVTRGGSFTGTVALVVEGSPSGVTATLGSVSLATGTNNTSLSIAVDSSAAPGTYPLTVRGTGTGVLATTTYTLTVTALPDPDPDFTLELPSTTLTIQEGDSLVTPVTIRRTGGFSGEVSLFLGGTPSNVRARITPSSTTDSTTSLSISVAFGVPAGSYPLVLEAGESGGPLSDSLNVTLVVTARPTAGALTLSDSSIRVVQTQPSEPVVVRLARPAGVTGPMELSFVGFGMTGTFTPNPVAGDSSLLVINTTLNTGAGTIRAVIRATVGDASTTAELLVTTSAFIPPNLGVSVTPTAVAVTAGTNTDATVLLARTNLTDSVSLVVGGLPAGMTATLTPSPTEPDSLTLDLNTTVAVAPGVYPITITGTADGIAGTRVATLSVTVNAPMSGGNVLWQFCEPSRFPLWFGVRSGTTGAWTPVTATNNAAGVSYDFPFDQAGQLAFVRNTPDGVAIDVFNTTPQEVIAQAANECASFRPTKTISGQVVVTNPPRGAVIVAGGAITSVPAGGGAFTLNGVKDGLTDIIAIMGVPSATGWATQERVIIRRDINPADGATLADFDFNGPEALFRNGANFSFRNLGGETFTVERSYVTANGDAGVYQITDPVTDSSTGLTGMPPAFRRPGNLHKAFARTMNPTAPRTITGYNESFSSPLLRFGPMLAEPTVAAVAGNDGARIRAAGSWSAEYGRRVEAIFEQEPGAPNARRVTMTASREFFGASGDFELETPNFIGVPGFNTSWMLRRGISTTWTVTETGVGIGTSLTPVDRTQIISGSRIGTVFP